MNPTVPNQRYRHTVLVFCAIAASGAWLSWAQGTPPGSDQVVPPAAPQTLRVPLSEEGRWVALKYDRRPVHTLQFSEAGLRVSVRHSAMPLLYPLPETVRVQTVRVKGRVDGEMSVPPARQGLKGYDDYALRVGLVLPGTTTLTWRERWLAADWVKSLYDLAPAGRGITKVQFLNLGVAGAQIGRARQHPVSKLLEEEVVATPNPDGSFYFIYTFAQPVEVCAIWISADGDDSKSTFQTLISLLELETSP